MVQFAKMVFLAAIVVANANLFAVSQPYQSIRQVPHEPYYLENSWILLNKVNAQSATVFIDVESPNGEAARFIAANASNELSVYSVNSWSEDEYQFQRFLSNVISENSTEKLIPIRMNSKEASNALNLVSELIYLDCNDISSINEKILTWVTHLSEHGAIAGNRWNWPDVELAVVNAAVGLNLTLTTNGNFWFLNKQ